MSELIRQINENILNSPDFTVIADGGEDNSFTYAQFDDCARRIAGKLIRQGVGRRDFVTIELPRNKEYIAAMYAVWLVGGAFAPLSPTYPAERLEFIRRDCGAKAVVNEKFLKGLPVAADLHLRLHRQAQGRPALPPQHQRFRPALLPLRRYAEGRPGGAGRAVHLRRVGAGRVQPARVVPDRVSHAV